MMKKQAVKVVLTLGIFGTAVPMLSGNIGARVVDDHQVSHLYGGALTPVCGSGSPVSCGGSGPKCTTVPGSKVTAPGPNQYTGVNCTTDNSADANCGTVMKISGQCAQAN